jgi:hypothetical protein
MPPRQDLRPGTPRLRRHVSPLPMAAVFSSPIDLVSVGLGICFAGSNPFLRGLARVLFVTAVWFSSAVQGERLRELPVPGDGEGERQRRQLHDPQLHRVTSMRHCHRLLLLYPIRPRISNTVFQVLELIKSSFWNAE